MANEVMCPYCGEMISEKATVCRHCGRLLTGSMKYDADGTGVWYNDIQCEQYETVCTVDDDLILWFYKDLHRK